jgi:hypothetical protein
MSTDCRNWIAVASAEDVRLGLFSIGDHDMDLIAEAMAARLP